MFTAVRSTVKIITPPPAPPSPDRGPLIKASTGTVVSCGTVYSSEWSLGFLVLSVDWPWWVGADASHPPSWFKSHFHLNHLYWKRVDRRAHGPSLEKSFNFKQEVKQSSLTPLISEKNVIPVGSALTSAHCLFVALAEIWLFFSFFEEGTNYED